MPKRTDIESILIIGAGPIVIGQACEFDYSGTQACKALREEGYKTILVNSNPATIMTDPGLADVTYIEPITPELVVKIIAKERPHALLPTMGGQTGLNTALTLARDGVLSKFDVEMIGASRDAIDKAEDRERFREAMGGIGLECPKSVLAHSMADAWQALERIGLPAIIRPSFTLGGTGSGIAYGKDDFEAVVAGGLDASPTSEVLIEESVLGWKEYEMEVIRDCADNCIIVCSIENVDPMGVHTGDSITVAPALTLTDKEYQIMRDASIKVLREIGVDTGGSNVQFAVEPSTGTPPRHRDEPQGLALVCAGLEGNRFPDRQGSGEACRRLPAGRAYERHHEGHPGLVRADDRLRRDEDAALCLREISRYGASAHYLDEIRRRGDGDRPHLRRILSEGPAFDGNRAHRIECAPTRRPRRTQGGPDLERRALMRRRPSACW